MPKVDGKRYEIDFQYHGTSDAGQDIPDKNNKINDIKINMTNDDSLSLTKLTIVKEKKMQDNKNGNMNSKIAKPSPI